MNWITYAITGLTVYAFILCGIIVLLGANRGRPTPWGGN